MAQNGWGDFPARFFMHTDAERKYAVGAARVHGSLIMDRWHRTTWRGNRMVESGCKRSGYGL